MASERRKKKIRNHSKYIKKVREVQPKLFPLEFFSYFYVHPKDFLWEKNKNNK